MLSFRYPQGGLEWKGVAEPRHCIWGAKCVEYCPHYMKQIWSMG